MVLKSFPIQFQLGPIKDTHHFLLLYFVLICLLGQDVLETFQAQFFFSQKGEIFLNIEPLNFNPQEHLNSLISIPVYHLKV